MTKKISHNSQFDHKDLITIQKYFHTLINDAPSRSWDEVTAEKYLAENSDKLPAITNELSGQDRQFFSVAGMYGGFAYTLLEKSGKPLLKVDSWSRVIGGSGQSHEITTSGIKLIKRFDA